MRIIIHADEVFHPDDFSGPKRSYRNGIYIARATIEPDEGEPYNVRWALEMRDGDLLYSWHDSPAGPLLENVNTKDMLQN